MSVFILMLSLTALATDQDKGTIETQNEVKKLFAQHRYPIHISEKTIEGKGGELIIQRAAASQFVALGESHYSVLTPQFTANLFKKLQPSGYNHLAIENGELSTRLLSQLLKEKDPIQAARSFFEKYYYAIPFYDALEEFQLLEAVTQTSTAPQALWGLDQEFSCSWRYFLDRLAELATDPADQKYFKGLAEKAHEVWKEVVKKQSLDITFSDRYANDELLKAMRQHVRGKNKQEMVEILEALEITTSIYSGDDWYRKHEERLRLFRKNFSRNFKAELARTGQPPKVITKMGSVHVSRGVTSGKHLDIGNFLSELAQFYDSRSFHILMLAFEFGKESERYKLVDDSPDYQYFLDGADPNQSWVIDFEAVRPHLSSKHLALFSDHVRNRILGYDAFVIVPHLGTTELLVPMPTP